MESVSQQHPLRIEQVAQRYGVNRRTVQRWFAMGLESFFLGTVRYTSEEAIDRFARWQHAAASVARDEQQQRLLDRNELARQRLIDMGLTNAGKDVNNDGHANPEI